MAAPARSGAAARLARACPAPAADHAVGRPSSTASLFGGLAAVTWKWLEANARRQLDSDRALSRRTAPGMAAAAAALSGARRGRRLRASSTRPRKTLRGWEWRHLRNRLASHGFDGEKDRIVMFDATSGKQTAVCEGHENASGRSLSARTAPDSRRLARTRRRGWWDPATGALSRHFSGAHEQGHRRRVQPERHAAS